MPHAAFERAKDKRLAMMVCGPRCLLQSQFFLELNED